MDGRGQIVVVWKGDMMPTSSRTHNRLASLVSPDSAVGLDSKAVADCASTCRDGVLPMQTRGRADRLGVTGHTHPLYSYINPPER